MNIKLMTFTGFYNGKASAILATLSSKLHQEQRQRRNQPQPEAASPRQDPASRHGRPGHGGDGHQQCHHAHRGAEPGGDPPGGGSEEPAHHHPARGEDAADGAAGPGGQAQCGGEADAPGRAAAEDGGGCYHGKLRSSLAEQRLREAGEGSYLVRKDEGAKENHKYILSTLSKGKITHTLVPTEYIKVKDVMEDIKKLVASCSHVDHCQKPLKRPEGDGDRVKVRMNPLACHVCSEDVPFENSKAKEKHVKDQHRVGECFKCGGFFPTNKMQGHRKTCKRTEFKCDTCDFITNRLDVMESHKKSHQKKYSCLHPGCDLVFTSLDERKKHSAQHPPRFPCLHCDRRFTTSYSRERHVNTKHWGMHAMEGQFPVLAGMEAELPMSATPAPSSGMEGQFPVHQHPLPTAPEGQFPGSVLPPVPDQQKILPEDGGNDGVPVKRKQKVMSSRKVHNCRHNECDYKTTVRMRLEKHMRIVHGAHKPRHQCSGCHKIFQDKWKLRRHTEGKRPCSKYQCSRPRIVQMWSNRGMIRVYKKQDGLSKRRFFKLIRDLQKEFDGKLI